MTRHRAAHRRRMRRRPLRVGLVVFVMALVAMMLLFFVEPMRVGSDSMSPTLRAGDHVLVDKVSGRAHDPQRGDIVAFRTPGGGAISVKRVVAVGGDRVGIEDGTLVVDGRPHREGFVDGSLVDGTYFGPIQVPPGSVFVLGDNRSNSLDSRRFGPVALNDVIGRVVARIRPP